MKRKEQRHTAASLSAVMETYQVASKGGAIYLSPYEWRMVIDALKRVAAERERGK